MKAILFLALIALTMSDVTGGWERRSINENDFEIDRSFRLAESQYYKTHKIEEDSLIRLTVYSQVVAGTNYKITFIDPSAEYPIVEEYTVFKGLKDEEKSNKEDFEISEHQSLEAQDGFIAVNDPLFDELDIKLYRFLKNTEEDLKFISYVYPISSLESNFYMINAYTSKGEHQYVIVQDKKTKEYYHYNKIK